MTTHDIRKLFTDQDNKEWTSKWFKVDQELINSFARVTQDNQFIHIDPDKAKRTKFGTTIAHGFLTMSLLSAMYYDAVPETEGMRMGINIGFDKLRFWRQSNVTTTFEECSCCQKLLKKILKLLQ